MNVFGYSARKTIGILAFLTMIPAVGLAFGGHWSGGKPKGPPREAIDACAGKKTGDPVQFTTPRGVRVSGICRDVRGDLAAVPEEWPWSRMGADRGKRFARMARKLDLTEDQREQIRAIRESEREKTDPFRKQIAETRKKIRQAIETQPFDETAVRSLAASLIDARVEMVVARADARSKIYALLTPEQRERAGRSGPWGGGRHGHRPWM